ncbi:MAG: hypothetical protein GY758_13010 [Fuerstiella sp.]|nr:hypothetical protein [Fuerstiella sp.]MCP4509172.1 hypothetical protein [Fuerstiella sp.]
MTDVDANPYATPAAIVETPVASTSDRSRIPPVLVSIGVAAYCGFTVLLLTSTDIDRQGGMVFLINFPLMLLWCVSIWKTDRFGPVLGVGAAAAQGIVARIMIRRDIGDDDVVYVINGGIILVILLLAVMCWVFRRRHRATVSEDPLEMS